MLVEPNYFIPSEVDAAVQGIVLCILNWQGATESRGTPWSESWERYPSRNGAKGDVTVQLVEWSLEGKVGRSTKMASDIPENVIVARMMGIERYRALSTVWMKGRIGLVRVDQRRRRQILITTSCIKLHLTKLRCHVLLSVRPSKPFGFKPQGVQVIRC